MKTFVPPSFLSSLLCWLALALPATGTQAGALPETAAVPDAHAATAAAPGAERALDASPQALERQLQSLPWEQFRAVVESEPRLKADVDAYGPLGWAYVQKKYRTHPWAHNIERLEPERRQQLAAKIRAVEASVAPHAPAHPAETPGGANP
ncbi:hypothetical protein B9N43_13695 [Denitratisoma sp. DHT3]|uniref:hypothetical protein n=1 Tax=Denitratisoma sp. DHT3 TaxID=1981880 RepID=UPI00119875B1|nr:hypothetical protein [Denitratisoma sp. DHT3]QDX82206.1 hypothetical protein B9N43_13695 [Denitratisoma sp. DHT3]